MAPAPPERPLDDAILRERARVLAQRTAASTGYDENLVRHPHLLFQVVGEAFALPMAQVREVLTDPAVTPIPGTPPAVGGVLNLRGAVVDVLRLEALLGLPRQGGLSRRQVVVCEVDGARFGAWVDGVLGIVSVFPEAMVAPPDTTPAGARSYLAGVVRQQGALVAVLDGARVLASPTLAPFRDPG